MQIDEAIDLADEWARHLTPHVQDGWRVACKVLADEVRRLRDDQASTTEMPRDEAVRKAWARFSNAVFCDEEAPYPGMIEAFETHFSQSFADKDWRIESGTWAAAWKAAKRHAEHGQAAPSVPAIGKLEPHSRVPDDYRNQASGYRAGWNDCRSAHRAFVDRMPAAAPKPSASPMTAAARDVLAERRRQIEAEGWTTEHDDEHSRGEMAVAAGYYALRCGYPHEREVGVPSYWPWDRTWWKPSEPRRDLIKAGALVLAEIERIDRAAAPKPESE